MIFGQWLPKEAYSVALVGRAISDPIEKWSEAWFVGTTANVSKVQTIATNHRAAKQSGFEMGGAHAALSISDSGKRDLLRASLGKDPSQQGSTESDTRLLDTFAKKIGQNLLDLLDAVFSRNVEGIGAVKVAITLSVGSREICDIVVSDNLLVPLLKASLGNSRPLAALAGKRTDALRRTRLTARAVLGHADLSLTEVKGLCAGDILILDRTLEDPIELRVTGHGPPVARGKIRRNGDKISIQL